jgi:hypothetical protein
MPTLRLTSLYCERKQDVTGEDETQIRVNGVVRWGPGKFEKDELAAMNVPVRFGDVAEVKVEEMNGDKAKQIGAAQLIRSANQPGSPVNFSTSGAHYVLHYTID